MMPIANYNTDPHGTANGANHVSWVPNSLYALLTGGQAYSTHPEVRDYEKLLYCPNRTEGWRWWGGGGTRLGYFNLYGHYGTNYTGAEPWRSITRINDTDASPFLSADVLERGTWNPPIDSGSHGRGGLTTWSPGGAPPASAGVEGTVLTTVDGATRWRAVGELVEYAVSRSSPHVYGWW